MFYGPLFFLVTTAAVKAANLDERCTRNKDCELDNSYCSVVTPSCGAGVCACLPGFILHGNECKRAAFLDQKCIPGIDQCVGDNVECSTEHQKCVCIYGYKRGLKGNDCVPNLMDRSMGESCYDTSQCYYSLVCLDNVCTCYSGFKALGDYNCQPREVNDACKMTEDCSESANTVCLNGQCSCAQGYRPVQYMTNKTNDFRTACIAQNDTQALEGQLCSFDALKPVYCKVPYVCTSCGDRSVCARRILPMMAGKSSKLPFPSSCVLEFFALISFLLL